MRFSVPDLMRWRWPWRVARSTESLPSRALDLRIRLSYSRADSAAARALSAALSQALLNVFGREAHYQQIADDMQGAIVVFDELNELIAFANQFAPEHLQFFMDPVESAELSARIETAGE